ncbi:hypothetical protein ACHAXR_003843 [Thalassiosira sp. AJA248-18]
MQVDSNGNDSHVMDGIIGHKKDKSAVTMDNAFVVSKLKWKEGTTQWIPLKVLKESNPVEVAEYEKSCGISHEPAFSWWVPFTLRKRDRIIAAINSRAAKKTHKYGLEIPTSFEHAKRINKENGNTM